MTGRIEKTVFISYRRTNLPWALFVYQNLTMHGYDVFFDYQSIDSGNFESVILDNIRARAHFIVILTPSALENCNKPGDWLRREIETAMDENRNVIPLMVENFDFGSIYAKEALTGKLASLSAYNGLPVPNAYALEAMERLRERYLNKILSNIPTPTLQVEAQKITETQKAAASEAEPVQAEQLTAQTWFERGYVFHLEKNLDEAIRCYTEAIHLQPENAETHSNRGVARRGKGDLDGAIRDFDEALRLQPDLSEVHLNRGNVLSDKGNFAGAIQNYDKAIQLNPNYALAYNNRGNIRRETGNLDGALQDLDEAIRLLANDAEAYNDRGIVRRKKGDFEGAIKDYNEAIRLNPDYAVAYNNRGLARGDKGDLENSIKDFDEAIRLNPQYANAYYNRAGSLEQQKKYFETIADLQKYLELGGGLRDGDQEDVEEKIKKLKSKLTKKRSSKQRSK